MKKNNLTIIKLKMTEILELGKSCLNEYQLDVFDECLKKKSGGLSLAMGSGKTLLSIVVALEQTKKTNKPILIIASKTLIESWKYEINKFFGDELKFIIFHNSYIKKFNDFVIDDDIKIYITTPEIVTKFYKYERISNYFVRQQIVNEGRFNQHFINYYNRPNRPFSNIKSGGSLLYSTEWGCLIIDEIQNYTKISTFKCQGIASICSEYRWGLSGTIFNEPVLERILGYYLIIDEPTFPRSLPDAKKFISSKEFKGTMETLVSRKSNPMFTKPKVNQYIITHNLSYEEILVYMSMRSIMLKIKNEIKKFKAMNDTINTRKFGTYLLAMITYLRQCLICCVIPLSSVAIDMIDFKNRSELSKILSDEINKLNINTWLNNMNSVLSSRMRKGLEIIDKHKKENLVVFTCFRTTIDILKEFIPSNRKVLTIESKMSSKARANVIEEFKKPNDKSDKGNILLVTYDIGSEGLNLQIANTVILLDFYWNDGKTSQSIARVLRYGQTSNEVNIYMFTSHTAIEKAIFQKQDLKLQIINELEKGSSKTKIGKLTVNDIIKMVEMEDNVSALEKVLERKK